jgi:hypothetical protein
MAKANRSRNTFDPEKGYVGVVLQQGVPLVDADWNEMSDIFRHELYAGLSLGFCDGVQPGTDALKVYVKGAYHNNGFRVHEGTMSIAGRAVTIKDSISYNYQVWRDTARAAADGVDELPDLTIPEEDRTDLVYADVWEREVNSAEDQDLVNPLIGLETSVRLKREVAIRVREDATELPEQPDNHRYLPLAFLYRRGRRIYVHDIEDIRPTLRLSSATGVDSFPPIFSLVSGTSWVTKYDIGNNGNGITAYTDSKGVVTGVLPLNLRDGLHLRSIRLALKISIEFEIGPETPQVSLQIQLIRQKLGDYTLLVDKKLLHAGYETLDSEFIFQVPEEHCIVDNTQYTYCLFVKKWGHRKNASVEIRGVWMHYEYAGGTYVIASTEAESVHVSHNFVVTSLENHSWVSIRGESGEVERRRTATQTHRFWVDNGGRYVVRTDGEIKTLSSEAIISS